MPPDTLTRHNVAVARTRAEFALLALIIGVGLPVLTLARALPAPATWPSWLTPLVLGAVVALAAARPVDRWVSRRTADPGRSTARYMQLFVGTWLAGLGAALVVLSAAQHVWPATGSPSVTAAGAILAALAPWLVVPLIGRRRPAWVRHPGARADPGAPAV